MMKRILTAVVIAGTLAGSSVTSAEAGPIRDKLRRAAFGAENAVVTVAKTSKLLVRCALKGHRGQIIC